MKIRYSDSSNNITYEFIDAIPFHKVAKGKVNLAALSLYGFYRNAIYNSYQEKSDLAEDIRTKKYEFNSRLNGIYQEPLYHYSIAASLGATQEWQNSAKKIQCYVAYEEKGGEKHRIGFVHFNEKQIQGKRVVYIAQAGVKCRGKGIGRHLMETILSHYSPGTEFYILTRVFNSEAKNLYEKRLSFTPIREAEIKELGYDSRYCGYKHTTTADEIAAIKSRQTEFTIIDNEVAATAQLN